MLFKNECVNSLGTRFDGNLKSLVVKLKPTIDILKVFDNRYTAYSFIKECFDDDDEHSIVTFYTVVGMCKSWWNS